MSQLKYFKIQDFQTLLLKFLVYVTQNLYPFSSFAQYFGSDSKEFYFICWVLVLIFDCGKFPFLLKNNRGKWRHIISNYDIIAHFHSHSYSLFTATEIVYSKL
jgi:hypothetical protein